MKKSFMIPDIVYAFLPIIILYISLSNSHGLATFSQTILGKILAICIIVYYTVMGNKLMGLLVCSLVILYYQSDIVENMLNMDDIMDNMFKKDKKDDENESEVEEDVEGMQTMQSHKKKDLIAKEPMANVKELYTAPSIVQKSLERMSNDIPREFREQNCDGEQLKYKDMNVKNEMIQHIFPEVEFEEEDCNVCKDTCEFSIIEQRLKKEKEMMSKMSRDEMKK
jgi:hypothetical protein